MNGIKAFLTVLFIMPIAHALTVIALKLPFSGQMVLVASVVAGAVIILYATKFITSPAWETFAGMIAGLLLWASLIEICLRIGAEAIEVEEIKAVQFSFAFFIPLFIYLMFNENIRCNFFIGIRKVLSLTVNPQKEIILDRWGPHVAFKFFVMVWIGHVVLYFAFDDAFFGIQSLFCKFLFVFCLVAGSYLFYRLIKAEKIDYAFRYAIPTVIVLWSCVETLVKWKIFSEPWITLNPLFLTVVFLAFAGIIFIIVWTEKMKK